MKEGRLDRVERLLEQLAMSQASSQAIFTEGQANINKALREMAARQQYHDEAFERMDAGIKDLVTTTKALSLIVANH